MAGARGQFFSLNACACSMSLVHHGERVAVASGVRYVRVCGADLRSSTSRMRSQSVFRARKLTFCARL
eukprot:2114228-Alexandrium_andersonii.AAC.1